MANQMTTYTFIICGVSLLFYFMGLVDSNRFLDVLFRPDNFTNANLFIVSGVAVTLIGALVLAAGVAVSVGFVVRYVDLIVKAALILVLIPMMWNIVVVFTLLAQYNVVLALLLFSPPLFNYLFVVIPDWWSGRD